MVALTSPHKRPRAGLWRGPDSPAGAETIWSSMESGVALEKQSQAHGCTAQPGVSPDDTQGLLTHPVAPGELPGLFVQPANDPSRLGRSILHWRVWLLARYKPPVSPPFPMSLPLTNDLHISSLAQEEVELQRALFDL